MTCLTISTRTQHAQSDTCYLEEARLLTQLGDVVAIIVREHVVAEDGISNLRGAKVGCE